MATLKYWKEREKIDLHETNDELKRNIAIMIIATLLICTVAFFI